MRLRNIIWDVDGTLFDTYPAIAGAMRTALHDLGVEVPLEQVSALAKVSLGYCLAVLANQYGLSEEDLVARFNGHYDRIGPGDQPPMPGAKELCAYILSLGGKNVIVTHRGRAGTAELLAAHGMAAYFAGCITRDDGYARKPDPAAFEAALTLFGLKRAETLSVGDREIDIQAGKAAGVFSCLYASESAQTTADLSVDNLETLQSFLKKRNG
jgi:HAD superfamily hydrolase (TIGR01509 family)